jgi:hypothetical protein
LLSRGEFAQLFKLFTPGNPTTPGNPAAELDSPCSLPWVTLSRVGISGELYLGVSVQVPTDDRDGTGRPISRTSYFCVPYAEFWSKPPGEDQPAGRDQEQAGKSSPVSYQALYAAALDQALPLEGGGGAATLEIPLMDAAVLADRVREFGETTVAATAAMLLGGPVTITGPGFPELMSRLRFFDAVAALLPYGYRPYLTAATWSDTGAGGPFRMVFANHPRDEASRVQWGAPPRLPANGISGRYFAYLERVLGPADGDQLRMLIEYLASNGEPRKFEEPEHAIACLHDFFLAETVSERAGVGDVPHADLRKVFATGQVKQLSPANRAQLLRQLISRANPQDIGLVAQWFPEIAAGHPSELVTAIALACRGELWSAGSPGLTRDYLRFLWQHGLSDEMLAQLVVRPESGTIPVEGLDAIGDLLKDFVIGVTGGPASYPRTQQALAGNPAVAAALLAGLAVSGAHGARSLDVAADWLAPVADQVVRPFVSLLSDVFSSGTGTAPKPVSPTALNELNRQAGLASVQYLLRAASSRSRLHLVLPGLACWLGFVYVEQGTLNEQASRYWENVSMELSPATMDEAAWLDLLLLVTRNSPRALLSGKYAQPHFSQRLAAAWRELAAAIQQRGGSQADEMLENALIAFLAQASWRGDTAHTVAVRNLASSLSIGAPRPRLMAQVLDARESLRQLPPGAEPVEIAQLCARAYHDGLSAGRTAEMLAESRAITTGTQAVEVLEEMHRALRAANARDASFEWPLTFARLFANGAFGTQLQADFPRFGAGRFAEQLEFQVLLLRMVIGGISPEWQSSSDLADYLDKNRHALEEVVKETRKRQTRGGGGLAGLFRGGKGGEGGPDDQGDQGRQGAPAGPAGPGSGGQA